MACIESNLDGTIDLPDGSLVQLAHTSLSWSGPWPDQPVVEVRNRRAVNGPTDGKMGFTNDGQFVYCNWYIVSRAEGEVPVDEPPALYLAAQRYSSDVVNKLPAGSWVVEIFDEEPFGEPFQVEPGDVSFNPDDQFVLLVIGSDEAIKAGDVIEKLDQLDRLPVGSIVLDETDDLCRKDEIGVWNTIDTPVDQPGLVVLQATVIRVGYAQSNS